MLGSAINKDCNSIRIVFQFGIHVEYDQVEVMWNRLILLVKDFTTVLYGVMVDVIVQIIFVKI